jgi:hypothetical protein
MFSEQGAEKAGLTPSKCPYEVQMALADGSRAAHTINRWLLDVELSANHAALTTIAAAYVVPKLPAHCDILLGRDVLFHKDALDATVTVLKVRQRIG